MRLISILLLLFVVSCASPQKNPDSFYAGKYAPAKLVVENDEFVVSATVRNKGDLEVARKAAYLKLMKSGQNRGYRYFKVLDTSKTNFIGSRYSIKGKLFKTVQAGKDVYLLSAISRVLQGLPIKKPYVAPKPVVKKPKPVALATPVRRPTPQPRPKPVSAPSPQPAIEPVPTPSTLPTPQPEVTLEPVVDPDDGPTVIMAPEDITGSIGAGPATQNVGTRANSAIALPKSNALSNIPTGVLLRPAGSSIY